MGTLRCCIQKQVRVCQSQSPVFVLSEVGELTTDHLRANSAAEIMLGFLPPEENPMKHSHVDMITVLKRMT